jgi:serine/threonine protein kinase
MLVSPPGFPELGLYPGVSWWYNPSVGGDPRLGTQLAGYVIESLVGRGGMGVVYLAQDLRLNRRVALKILPPEISGDERFRARFVRESRIAAGLEHPNIIPIYEADEADGELFIAMRYVGGSDLEELIRRAGPLDVSRASSIVSQTASALDAAHEQGLVHRDVKPANLLLAPHGTEHGEDHVYVSDFGITKRLDTLGSTASTGRMLGSLDYVAPEQIEGAPVDRRADVYSLGCVLYQCLTATVPFPRESEMAVMWAHVHDDPPRVSGIRPDLPTGVDAVIARAMAKKPTERFESTGRLASATRSALSEATLKTVPVTSAPGSRRRSPRRWPWAVAGAALFVAAATGTGTYLAMQVRSRPRPTNLPSSAPSSGGPLSPITSATFRRVDADGHALGTKHFPAPAGVTAIALGEGSIWSLTPRGVYATNLVSGTSWKVHVPATTTATDVDVGGGAVYVSARTEAGTGEVLKIGPTTRKVAFTYQSPHPIDAVVAGPEYVWALSEEAGTVTELNASGLQSVRTLDVGVGVSDLAINQYVWVLNKRMGELEQIAPKTGQLRQTAPISGRATAIAAGDSGVWVVDRPAGYVFPFETVTASSTGPPIPLGGSPSQIVDASARVWVAAGKTLWNIDPGSHTTSHIQMPARIIAIAADQSLPAPMPRDVWVLLGPPGS